MFSSPTLPLSLVRGVRLPLETMTLPSTPPASGDFHPLLGEGQTPSLVQL